MSEPTVSHHPDKQRYELSLDDTVIGRIDYARQGDVLDLRHTEVNPEHGGKGYAAILADFVLDDARAQGLTVTPTCPYIARHIEKNPEYGSLVAHS